MLSLIDFKRSVFAGVLDGGSDEVFLGGSRLKNFMDTVERASGNIPPSMPPHETSTPAQEEVVSDARMAKEEARDEKARAAATATPAGAHVVWTDLAAAGLTFLEKLGQALQSSGSAETGDRHPAQPASSMALPDSLISRDERTGEPCLKLPLPKPRC